MLGVWWGGLGSSVGLSRSDESGCLRVRIAHWWAERRLETIYWMHLVRLIGAQIISSHIQIGD